MLQHAKCFIWISCHSVPICDLEKVRLTVPFVHGASKLVTCWLSCRNIVMPQRCAGAGVVGHDGAVVQRLPPRAAVAPPGDQRSAERTEGRDYYQHLLLCIRLVLCKQLLLCNLPLLYAQVLPIGTSCLCPAYINLPNDLPNVLKVEITTISVCSANNLCFASSFRSVISICSTCKPLPFKQLMLDMQLVPCMHQHTQKQLFATKAPPSLLGPCALSASSAIKVPSAAPA